MIFIIINFCIIICNRIEFLGIGLGIVFICFYRGFNIGKFCIFYG